MLSFLFIPTKLEIKALIVKIVSLKYLCISKDPLNPGKKIKVLKVRFPVFFE